MQFASPEWFLLIPIFAAAGWYWKRLRLWSPLRLVAILLIVTALADPQVRQSRQGMDLWVLVDRSASASDLAEESFEEWKRLLDRSRPSRFDNLRFVDFAGEVVESHSGGETETFTGNTGYTRSRLALESVVAMQREDRHSRILMFTDGFSTEPLGDIGQRLANEEIPLDYRIVQPDEAVDYQVTALDMPHRRRLGEPFIVEVTVRGNQDGTVPIEIARGDAEPQTAEVEIVNGIGSLQFSTRLGTPGAHQYVARLTVEDGYRGNNEFENWIEITGGPRVLLVSRYDNDPVATILRAQGFQVEQVSEPGTLQVGQLSGARVVILNNVPAYEIPLDFLRAVDFFVREQAGGLMMVGGKHSFASGGYFESAIDELLPVSMELKTEHRKLAVAMAIIMDRSGSMSMTVPGGRTKMDMANEGSARAVELLGEFDQVTVFAVDSSAHKEVPLTMVGPNRGTIVNRVRRIQSMGGGIFVYTGLKAGWQELEPAQVGQYHIILFSDAMDSEEPGAYRSLVKKITDAGGTISVIGLGTKSDVDAAFLEDIAKRGNGRTFFTNDPTYIPNIFAQETVTVARSMFVEEPVPTLSTGQWLEVSGSNVEWLNQVDGYNLSYLRENASAGLISGDDYNAPMVSWVQRGLGRTSAVSFPLGGEFSEAVRGWEPMGDFVQTLTRWLMGEEVPPGIALRTELDGTQFSMDLLHDDSWVERLATPPRIFIVEEGGMDEPREITWQRLAPGQFRATTDLEHGRMVRGAIQVGNTALPFGPIVVGSSPEWSFDPIRQEELRQASRVSGGQALVDLKDAWQRPEVKEFATIQPWLFTLLLLVLLLDALFTRMGWQIPVMKVIRDSAAQVSAKASVPRPKKRREVSPSVAEAKPGTSTEEPAKTTEAPKKPKSSPRKPDAPKAGKQDAEAAEESRRSRFDRAKKRR